MRSAQKKILAVLSVIIIVVLIIIGGVYFFTKDKNIQKIRYGSTADSDIRTYTNTKYGFQLTYPENWKVVVQAVSYPSIIFTTNKGSDFHLFIDDPITDVNGNTITLDKYLDIYSYNHNYTKENKTINGYFALKFESIGDPKSIRYIFVKENVKYEFVFNSNKEKEEDVRLFNNLVNTLEFL